MDTSADVLQLIEEAYKTFSKGQEIYSRLYM